MRFKVGAAIKLGHAFGTELGHRESGCLGLQILLELPLAVRLAFKTREVRGIRGNKAHRAFQRKSVSLPVVGIHEGHERILLHGVNRGSGFVLHKLPVAIAFLELGSNGFVQSRKSIYNNHARIIANTIQVSSGF